MNRRTRSHSRRLLVSRRLRAITTRLAVALTLTILTLVASIVWDTGHKSDPQDSLIIRLDSHEFAILRTRSLTADRMLVMHINAFLGPNYYGNYFDDSMYTKPEQWAVEAAREASSHGEAFYEIESRGWPFRWISGARACYQHSYEWRFYDSIPLSRHRNLSVPLDPRLLPCNISWGALGINVLLFLTALTFLRSFLLHWRSRTRKTKNCCHQCGYSLAGHSSARLRACSECGVGLRQEGAIGQSTVTRCPAPLLSTPRRV
jgi:hypothetical protein